VNDEKNLNLKKIKTISKKNPIASARAHCACACLCVYVNKSRLTATGSILNHLNKKFLLNSKPAWKPQKYRSFFGPAEFLLSVLIGIDLHMLMLPLKQVGDPLSVTPEIPAYNPLILTAATTDSTPRHRITPNQLQHQQSNSLEFVKHEFGSTDGSAKESALSRLLETSELPLSPMKV
jgi:hypothetical protein